uniref:Uncharacterized protein n=1 Tax=Anopheles stephensi TaxID=30069 RepID=A0A182Y6J4_ANOST
MGDFAHTENIPKKYYRYFLKGLAYYTCHLNKACTRTDLQAYVFLKSLQQLTEADLKFLSDHVMKHLVSTGIANEQNGYYRLNELLRYAHGSSSQRAEASAQSRDAELSSGSGLRKMVNFSSTVTMWPTDTMDGVAIIDANPTESGPTMIDQDVEKRADKTESDADSDEDADDKAKTAPNALQGKTDQGKQTDTDSSDSNTSETLEVGSDDDGDADDENSNITQKPTKQEPDGESKKSESEDDTRKQE